MTLIYFILVRIESSSCFDIDSQQEETLQLMVVYFLVHEQAFTDNDIHHRGRVSRDTLRKILNEHAFRMNDEQFDHVWGKFGSDADRAIDYKEFLKEYSSRPDVRRASSATPTRSRERQVQLNRDSRTRMPVASFFVFVACLLYFARFPFVYSC